jgi:sec-independent protein translocase protein TatB
MLSIPHMIIIFVVALVVFGPEKLPELARNLGKVMAEFRRATGDLRSTFEDHLRDLEREAEVRRIGSGSSPQPSQAAETNIAAPGTVPTNAVPSLRPHNDSAVAPSEGPATGDTPAESEPGKTESDSEHVSDGHPPA